MIYEKGVIFTLLHSEIGDINSSATVIDVAAGDGWIDKFKMIWDAVRWSDLPYDHKIFLQ